MTLEYLVTSLIVVLLPGTGVIYTLAFGLGRGWRASVLAAFGCTLGIVPHAVASTAGLAALLYTSALAFQVVKYLGVAYLLYMAWGVLQERDALQVSGRSEPTPDIRIVVDGVLLNILNPKLSLFFLAFLPQFVPGSAVAPAEYMLGLAAVFMLLTFVIFVGYGAFASAVRRYVVSSPGVMVWCRRGFAAVFVALGVRLALAER
ncbi:LysE family translocator [Arhodomonas sp. KWT2]|uniref:LysE family translocator n=1 Tax=unclassified Arhodomonas TaxID=2621637 RepID=UPI0013D6F102|nr:LysE family translocator [Arhodomonas sp. KWT]